MKYTIEELKSMIDSLDVQIPHVEEEVKRLLAEADRLAALQLGLEAEQSAWKRELARLEAEERPSAEEMQAANLTAYARGDGCAKPARTPLSEMAREGDVLELRYSQSHPLEEHTITGVCGPSIDLKALSNGETWALRRECLDIFARLKLCPETVSVGDMVNPATTRGHQEFIKLWTVTSAEYGEGIEITDSVNYRWLWSWEEFNGTFDMMVRSVKEESDAT